MKQTSPVSDEMINAYIDNELEAEDYNYISEIARSDQELSNNIFQARKLKALVKAAKKQQPMNMESIVTIKTWSDKIVYLAASVALVVITALTTMSFNHSDITRTEFYKNNSLPTKILAQQNINLVLHLKTTEKKQVDKLFNVLQSVLETTIKSNKNVQVEVVLTGPGLYLLQQNTSTYIHTIQNIGKNYSNVTFIACGITLEKLQKKSPQNIKIIKDAMLVASGPAWIKKRKQQGWTYLYI